MNNKTYFCNSENCIKNFPDLLSVLNGIENPLVIYFKAQDNIEDVISKELKNDGGFPGPNPTIEPFLNIETNQNIKVAQVKIGDIYQDDQDIIEAKRTVTSQNSEFTFGELNQIRKTLKCFKSNAF